MIFLKSIYRIFLTECLAVLSFPSSAYLCFLTNSSQGEGFYYDQVAEADFPCPPGLGFNTTECACSNVIGDTTTSKLRVCYCSRLGMFALSCLPCPVFKIFFFSEFEMWLSRMGEQEKLLSSLQPHSLTHPHTHK